MSAKVYVHAQPNTEYVEVGLQWEDESKKRTPLLFLKQREASDLIRDLGKAVRALEEAR